jgi:hypothetical protein
MFQCFIINWSLVDQWITEWKQRTEGTIHDFVEFSVFITRTMGVIQNFPYF